MLIFAHGWSEGFDGTGRRWVLYLKGCNMRCRWCTNPEGMNTGPEMLFYPGRGREPELACPLGAVRKEAGQHHLEREICDRCEDHPCLTRWRHPAFELAGSSLAPSEVVDKAVGYRGLFTGGGGVTFGGGEATLQAADVAESLERLDREGIHTAVETNMAAPGLDAVRSRTRLLICDLKAVDPDLHRAWTGVDNRTILENLRLCAADQPQMWVRLPLVTGMNDNDQEMDRIAGLLAELGSMRSDHGRSPLVVEVLPLHHAGQPKYTAMDREYPMAEAPVPGPEKIEAMLQRLRRAGVVGRLAGRHYSGA